MGTFQTAQLTRQNLINFNVLPTSVKIWEAFLIKANTQHYHYWLYFTWAWRSVCDLHVIAPVASKEKGDRKVAFDNACRKVV